MADSPHVRLRHPNRKRQPHVGESLDPVVTRKGSNGSVGALVLLAAGLVFFCYIFDMGGLKSVLDGLFSGADTKARSHSAEVTTYFTSALPYIGIAVVAVIVLVFFGILGRGAESLVSSRKKKPAPAPKPRADSPEVPRPAAEFILPARLAAREEDLKPKVTLPKPPQAD